MYKFKKKNNKKNPLKYALAYYNYNDFCRSVLICKFLPSFIPTCAVAAHFDPNHTDPDKSTSMKSLIGPFPKPNRFLSHLITGKLTIKSIPMTRVVIRNKYWQQNTVQEQITVYTADLSYDYTKLIHKPTRKYTY